MSPVRVAPAQRPWSAQALSERPRLLSAASTSRSERTLARPRRKSIWDGSLGGSPGSGGSARGTGASWKQSVLTGLVGLNGSDSLAFPSDVFADFIGLVRKAGGFQDHSSESFKLITESWAKVLGAAECRLYILEGSKLYTYRRDRDTKLYEHVEQETSEGIVGQVFVANEVLRDSHLKSHPVLSARAMVEGVYNILAVPFKDNDGETIGIVELRNKKSRHGFTAADEQMSLIVTAQVSHAVVQSRRNAYLEVKATTFVNLYDDHEDRVVVHNNHEEQETRRAKTDAIASMLGVALDHASELAAWSFNLWEHDPDQFLIYLIDMFEDAGLISRYRIEIPTFRDFVARVRAGYLQENPYHNWEHGFDVTHMSYLIIKHCDVGGKLSDFDKLSVLLSAMVHDIGHTGQSNPFHAAASTDLAIAYNDISVLENHSCALTFRILRDPNANILKFLDAVEARKLRSRLIEMVLNTDAKKHFSMMTRFQHGLDTKEVPRTLLVSMILHAADVSNPARPFEIAKAWAFRVQEEFFRQGDKEREIGIKQTPYMDRKAENLPKMQVTFIDMIVEPLFLELSKPFPKLRELGHQYCLDNRERWHQLSASGISTERQLRERDAERRSGEEVLPAQGPVPAAPGSTGAGTDGEPAAPVPIPGIPVDAQSRRASMVNLAAGKQGDAEGRRRSSIQMQIAEIRKQTLKENLRDLLDFKWTQVVLFLATVWALFGDDMNLACGPRANDFGVQVVHLACFSVFLLEICISVYVVKDYPKFFLWLDLVATASLLFDVHFLFEDDAGDDNSDKLTLARAGRAAKAGARAGRLARLMRLLRMTRIFKIYKILSGPRKAKTEIVINEFGEEALEVVEKEEQRMSNVWRKLTEKITQRVIVSVIIMLLAFSFNLDVDTPDAREFSMRRIQDDIDEHGVLSPEANETIAWYVTEYGSTLIEIAIRTDAAAYAHEYADSTGIRDVEMLEYSTPNVVAVHDVREQVRVGAWLSVASAIFVTMLLTVLSMAFSRDAYTLMIRPIEKMNNTLAELSKNPLLHIQEEDDLDVKKENRNETDTLQAAIGKMARLLQIGFGIAGAEVISKIFSEDGELNPVVPGTRIDAIFGFCDIRDFTSTTECLKEEVMLFVNIVAGIVHRTTVETNGAPNKNIGDAFLLVWRLRSTGAMQSDVFDGALFAMLQMNHEVSESEALLSMLTSNAAYMKLKAGESPTVQLGCGLHTGWAIEGSIGSKVKVDASYLSPHVNTAARLESATKQFQRFLLMSEAFVFNLSGTHKSKTRRADVVVFKGAQEPMSVYVYDRRTIEVPAAAECDALVAELKRASAGLNMPVEIDEVERALKSGRRTYVRRIYDMAFKKYVSGRWPEASCLFRLWLTCFPGDATGRLVLDFIESQRGQAPPDWAGFRRLGQK